MVLRKVQRLLIALLVLGLLGPGSGLIVPRLWAQEPVDKSKAKEPEAGPREEAGKPKKRPQDRPAVLKARVAVAEKAYQAAFAGIGHTQRIGNVLSFTHKPEEVYTWSARWLQAQRDLSPKHEDQLTALEAHVKRMTTLKKVVESLSKDLLPAIKIDETEWYLLEAELWLMEAKAAKK